jgi:hypothetical protein
MQARLSLILLALGALIGCKGDPKTTESAETPEVKSEVQAEKIANPNAEVYKGERVDSREFCFVSKSAVTIADSKGFNYYFLRFTVTDGDSAEGTFLSSPYGTDGSRGSFKGIYREDKNLLQTTTTYLAEGERYEEQRDYTLGADGIALVDGSGKPVMKMPVVSCEQYNEEMKMYRQNILKNKVNTSDRTRLKKVKEVLEFGYTEEQLDNVRFMELQIDLDNNYQTEEYLLYIMDPMLCGSGGCNLLIIDDNGKTLSNTTVVKLPLYMPVATVEDMQNKGDWKPLFVWSQGFRKLASEDGSYPSNASMAPEFPENELTGRPEKYQLVLDYLD